MNPLFRKEELLRYQKESREKQQRQKEKEKRHKGKLLKTTAGSHSGVASTETNADKGGGSGSKRESSASRANGMTSALKAEADAGGASSGKLRASSEERHSDCEIVGESADKRKGGASSAEHDSDAQPVESTADGHGQCKRDDASSKRRKTSRGKSLKLEAPFPSSGTEKYDQKCLVKHMSPGESCQVQVQTEIPLQHLEFLRTENIESFFDKERMLVNITTLDCTSVNSDFATIQFVHTPTGKVIGTIEICNKSSSVSTSSQQSAGANRRTHLATLGLPPNASDSDITKAYRTKALVWHPDKQGSTCEWARDMWDRVQAAYTALTRKD
jgi:hypothetical protein